MRQARGGGGQTCRRMNLESRNEYALGGSSNYPTGADTSDAPWNQASPDDCETCAGQGVVACPECRGLKRDGSCPACEAGTVECEECRGSGEGETPSARREREAEEKADAARDEEKDEPRDAYEA